MLCMLEISRATFTFDTAFFFYPPHSLERELTQIADMFAAHGIQNTI